MKTGVRRLVAAGTIAAIVAATMGLTSCGGKPIDVDPQVVLDAASANMKALAGFHFVYQLNQPESAKKAEGVQGVEADINDKGETQAKVQYLTGGSLINVDVIALADIHYVRFPLAPSWVKFKPEDSPLQNLNLAGLPVQILDKITSPNVVGIEKRGGKSTYHITGRVTKEDIENIAGNVSTADIFVTDLWVGVDDSLLYEVDILGPMTKDEPAGAFRSIVLSKLGVSTDIKAPQ